MKYAKLIGHLLIIVILTIVTQVGGIIWLIGLRISKHFSLRKRYVFPILYLFCNLIIVPPIAKVYGREQLPWFDKNIKPRNWFYPLSFRNYVHPELYHLLYETSKNSGVSITYLDANFPFFDGYPLLPHLSHDDGKKVDLSFMYLDKNGNPTDKKPSVSGYGIYAESNKNQTLKQCIGNGYWQYDFSKYLSFGRINTLKLDFKHTKKLTETLSNHPKTQKLFIEPHLKYVLGLSQQQKIRFHGCQSVRHDDHIHLQIK